MPKILEVNVPGTFLSVYMEVSGSEDSTHQVRMVVDLLHPGLADDPAADEVKLVFKQVFGVEYGHEIQMTLQKGVVPADWLAKKVSDVDDLLNIAEKYPSFKYA